MSDTPMSRCKTHDRPLEWMEIRPGRQRFQCPECAKQSYEQWLHNLHNVPRIKFTQNFFRDRPYSEAERRNPARKPVD